MDQIILLRVTIFSSESFITLEPYTLEIDTNINSPQTITLLAPKVVA